MKTERRFADLVKTVLVRHMTAGERYSNREQKKLASLAHVLQPCPPSIDVNFFSSSIPRPPRQRSIRAFSPSTPPPHFFSSRVRSIISVRISPDTIVNIITYRINYYFSFFRSLRGRRPRSSPPSENRSFGRGTIIIGRACTAQLSLLSSPVFTIFFFLQLLIRFHLFFADFFYYSSDFRTPRPLFCVIYYYNYFCWYRTKIIFFLYPPFVYII